MTRLARRIGPIRALIVALAVMLAAGATRAADGIEFDVSAFEKKPFESSGYLELKPEYQRLDRASAQYGLQFPEDMRTGLARTSSAAEFSGVYRHDDLRLHFTGHASYVDDARGWSRDARLYEGYVAWQPRFNASVELGQRTLRWGKGYAFSPIAFFERSKDPTDPELSREGFVMAAGSWVRSSSGPLTTLSVVPVVLPVGSGLNEDYGTASHANAGIKGYALFYDTDIDLGYAAPGSRGGARVGADFSRNLGTNLEIHGEWAHIDDAARTLLAADNALTIQRRSYDSFLLGVRYLTEQQTTIIVEYYRNGGGYSRDEMQRFFALAHAASVNPLLRPVAARAAGAGYAGPNPMRHYVYLRLSQPEPFDILYFTPALTAIVDTDDRSATLIPEATYTRVKNLELRLRLQFNTGDRLDDYGEKPVRRRVELRARLSF
jgi:hypothetical protein